MILSKIQFTLCCYKSSLVNSQDTIFVAVTETLCNLPQWCVNVLNVLTSKVNCLK